jgi:RNA polymerase sigma factor (sigma-70 family)
MNTNREAFDSFLSRLEPELRDSEQRYKRVRQKMIKFFEWRRCEDSYSLADETITRILKNVREGEEIRSLNPYSYVYAIAMNIFREYLREKKKQNEIRSTTQELLSEQDLSIWPEDIQDCREACLNSLSSKDRRLITLYYRNAYDKEVLARELGMSYNALRVQVYRIKKELRACYKDCLKKDS